MEAIRKDRGCIRDKGERRQSWIKTPVVSEVEKRRRRRILSKAFVNGERLTAQKQLRRRSLLASWLNRNRFGKLASLIFLSTLLHRCQYHVNPSLPASSREKTLDQALPVFNRGRFASSITPTNSRGRNVISAFPASSRGSTIGTIVRQPSKPTTQIFRLLQAFLVFYCLYSPPVLFLNISWLSTKEEVYLAVAKHFLAMSRGRIFAYGPPLSQPYSPDPRQIFFQRPASSCVKVIQISLKTSCSNPISNESVVLFFPIKGFVPLRIFLQWVLTRLRFV